METRGGIRRTLWPAHVAREAIAMQGIVYGDVQERFRRQLIVARECGPAATMDDFLLACGAEVIDPILKRNTI